MSIVKKHQRQGATALTRSDRSFPWFKPALMGQPLRAIRPKLVAWVTVMSLGLLLLTAVLPLPGEAQLAPPPFDLAQSLPELQQQQNQLNQKRQQVQQQQNQLQNQQSSSEEKLEDLQQSIVATDQQIAQTVAQLAAAEQRLDVLKAEEAHLQAVYDASQKATVARLQFLQRQQGSEGWAVLLQSQDFNEFLDRQYQLKRVYQADKSVLDDLQNKAQQLAEKKAVVEAQKNQVALLRQQLLSQKQQYEAEAQSEQQLIARLKQERAALEAAEAQLVQDSESIGALIRQKIAASTGILRGTGRFVYPANANITSRFGPRVHPILGYRRFHAGIDFGASYGSTIRAADAGQVIFSGWYGGYGQTVIIDHGGELTTLYGHSSRLLVSEGQTVQAGQAIATVGSTGLSTGPHLHFEVRQNGNPVNPMGYL